MKNLIVLLVTFVCGAATSFASPADEIVFYRSNHTYAAFSEKRSQIFLFKRDLLAALQDLIDHAKDFGLNAKERQAAQRSQEAIKKLKTLGFYELNPELTWGKQDEAIHWLLARRKVWVCCDTDNGLEEAASLKSEWRNEQGEKAEYWISSRDGRAIWFRDRSFQRKPSEKASKPKGQ